MGQILIKILTLQLRASCSPLHSVERETGIEPASLAWKARVLPLNYSRALQKHVGLQIHLKINLLVDEAGFEPAYALASRFTVCLL